MIVLLAVVAGILFAAAIYLMLRRSVLKLALGLSLMANAANLVIFVLGFFIDFFEIAFIILPLLVPAAKILGISRKNLWEKMKDYRIE